MCVLPLPSEFLSGPRSASAPANAGKIDQTTMVMIEVQRTMMTLRAMMTMVTMEVQRDHDDDPKGDEDNDDSDASD